MQLPPLSVIVQWPRPNYVDPETRGDALLALMIIFSVLVLLAVGGRFYSRFMIKNRVGWDDGMILLALIFTIGMNVTVLLANRKYGWDRHIWDVQNDMIQNANIIAFTAKLLFVAASTFTRMSLICFYYRIVRDSGIDWFRWILHISMIFIVALGIAFTCVGIWLCIPVQSYWLYPPDFGNYKCMNEGTVTLIVGIINCFADLLTTLLPIPIVMKLQMPVKQRIGVCILLTLGFVVTIAGIVRTYYIWKSLIDSWDETWFSYPLWICAAIEIDVAVICACAPALKPLLHKHLSRVTSRISSKISSLRSSANRTPPANNALSSNSRTSKFRFPFRKKSGGDSIWDGDEEYGMLKQREKEKQLASSSTKTDANGEPLELQNSAVSNLNGSGSRRKPTLEILKRQSVDQAVEYVTAGAQEEGAAGIVSGSAGSRSRSRSRELGLDFD